MDRRQIIKANASIIGVWLGGCQSPIEEAPAESSTEETPTESSTEETPTEISEVRKQALAYAEEWSPSTRDGVADFINDNQLEKRFIDEQLKLWMSAPDSIPNGRVKLNRYPKRIVRSGGLYENDWNKNGQPHLLPDGTHGPDYSYPFKPNPDNDPFMPRFYNSSRTVHNVKTGEYRGFQPEKGDKVGKLGDKNGDGSITSYLQNDVTPNDLIGNMITVTWMDTSGQTDQVEETFDILEDFFRKKPPNDTSIDFYGINSSLRSDIEPPPGAPADGNELIEYFELNVPDVLKGPVNYMVLVEEPREGAGGTALATDLSPGAWGSAVGHGEFRAAYLTLHELYWHGLTSKPHLDERPEDTLASYPPYPRNADELDFLDKEWEFIFDAMNGMNREYFEHEI
jgi:hypothetical protein